MLGELSVLHHVFDFQRFDAHRLVVVNNSSREFMLEVITGIGHPLMRLGHQQPCFGTLGPGVLCSR